MRGSVIGVTFLILPLVVSACKSLYRCEGSQTRCGYQSADTCTKVPECSLITGCTDLGASNCGIFKETVCRDTPELCTWHDNGCFGPCENRSQAGCEIVRGCKWAACTGRVRACSSFDGDHCPTWNGCYLEPTM